MRVRRKGDMFSSETPKERWWKCVAANGCCKDDLQHVKHVRGSISISICNTQ
jgi:hypothetical protein